MLRAGRAALFILETVGWPVGWMRLPPVVWLVELGYAIVAANRKAFTRWLILAEKEPFQRRLRNRGKP